MSSVEALTNVLLKSGLLTADRLNALVAELPAADRPQDAAVFVKLLTARGLVTPFQAQELLAGRGLRLVMGDYVILQEIGAGGMGQVYKAQHRRMARIVALKVMSAAAMKDAASVKRFQREVRAAARLEHPNIVTAYASGESGDVKYLVMQFVDGGDLSALVKKNGPLPVEQAVGYMLQAARGLSYAHGEGVIHRDVKPANLLLDKKGVIKILDMGLARIENGDDGLTATEQVMGTVDYMSPEQASSTKGVDARADIYSLGCTLWYLLTGKKLYEADTMIARLMAHRDGPLPSLVKARDDAPWPLEQALHKMIAKQAANRFASMDEVVQALEPFGPGGGSATNAGSTQGRGPGADSAEMAAFKQGMPLTTGSQVKESPSKSKAAVGTAASLSSSDAGTDPQSRTLGTARPVSRETPSSARVAKPQRKGPAPLVLGGVAALAISVLAAIVWLSTRGGETGDAVEVVQPTSLTAAAPIARPSVSPSPPTSSTGTSVLEKLESVKYVWTALENLGPRVNNSLPNRTPTLTADQLCLMVVTEQNGQSDLVEFRRASLQEPWSKPRYCSGCDSEHAPALRADGLEVIFSSLNYRPAGYVGGYDLWSRRRASRDAPWDLPKSLGPNINTSVDDSGPCLSPDGLMLAFHSSRPGGFGGSDLYVSRRATLTAPFDPPVNLGRGINTEGNEHFPRFITGTNDLLLERNGELFATFRNKAGIVGAMPLPMSGGKFTAAWLASDGATLYFQRDNHPGGRGSFDIWLTRRVPFDSPEASRPAPVVADEPLPTVQGVTFAGHSYQWLPGELTWYEAQRLAEALGGHLATVNSAAESDWLKQTLLAKLPSERMVWIGGVKDGRGTWRWSTDEPMDFEDWSPNEGVDGPVSAIGLIQGNGRFGWADWNAGTRAVAVGGTIAGQSRNVGCVVEWDSPTPTPQKVDAGETFNGHRYLIVADLVDWNAAKAAAEARGGHLLTINDAAERDWVRQRLWPRASTIDAIGRFYFGGYRKSASLPWQWVTEEPFDPQLWLGRAADDQANELRVVSWQWEQTWDDVAPNWNLLPYVIEWDDLTAGTAAPPKQP